MSPAAAILPPACSPAAFQQDLEKPWGTLGPLFSEPEGTLGQRGQSQGCPDPSPAMGMLHLESLLPLVFEECEQSRWKKYFFNFLDDTTCILNNNEPINYKKLNNQKSMYVELGVFIN